jgi:hypothetical protein
VAGERRLKIVTPYGASFNRLINIYLVRAEALGRLRSKLNFRKTLPLGNDSELRWGEVSSPHNRLMWVLAMMLDMVGFSCIWVEIWEVDHHGIYILV